MPHIQWPLLIFALVLASTVVVVVRSTPHRRYCGRHLTKALIALCGTVKAPSSDQLETGRRPSGDHGIVHECCRKSCDEKFMRRYCAERKISEAVHRVERHNIGNYRPICLLSVVYIQAAHSRIGSAERWKKDSNAKVQDFGEDQHDLPHAHHYEAHRSVARVQAAAVSYVHGREQGVRRVPD